jgi:glycerol-3-phosphate acyltransferase PlsX
MGGDHAPEEIVAGARLAAADGGVELILVGDEGRIRPLLGESPLQVVHAPRAISMEEHPSAALRIEDSSLNVAIGLVRDGRADAVVSAGNSGAFLAIGAVRLRKIAGIARPAIAVVMPGKKGPVVILDSGANVDCRPEWLAEFGLMGSAYASASLHIANPRVGIISVGEERTKGNAQTIEAARLLDAAPLNFVGNVEGGDIFNDLVDVVVSDGFVGNVMLKLAEGASSVIIDVIREEIMAGGLLVKLGALLMRPAMRRVRARIEYESYGGAPLLGLRGNCIVAHGRASRIAIRNAINAAIIEVKEDVVGKITELVAASSSIIPARTEPV